MARIDTGGKNPDDNTASQQKNGTYCSGGKEKKFGKPKGNQKHTISKKETITVGRGVVPTSGETQREEDYEEKGAPYPISEKDRKEKNREDRGGSWQC